MPLSPTEELELLLLLDADERAKVDWPAEKLKCADGIEGLLYWWDKYLLTYDPRRIGKKDPVTKKQLSAFVPFELFPKQREIVRWTYERITIGEEGLFEKSREVGATYIMAGVFLWFWLYQEGFKGTFGSRIEKYVDNADNLDAIFPKMRLMLYGLPPQLMPKDFRKSKHDHFMKLINPENNASITGEGGDNMGRGGRSTVYCLDEAAHVQHAETIEAALSANTECILWVSSVLGMGNLFARKRHSILEPHQIARMHWRDDPRKTEEWAAKKKASFSNPATWASEFEIDYTASVEGICIPALWVDACKRVLKLEPGLQAMQRMLNYGVMGLDVGAGKAKSIAVTRKGMFVMPPHQRGDPDTTGTAYWGLQIAKDEGAAELNFDSPGVGFGVSSTLSLATNKGGIQVNAINTGNPPSGKRVWPDGRKSEDTFGNMKAEIWWLCRLAAQATHEHVLFLEGDPNGVQHELRDLMVLPHGDVNSDQLCLQMTLVKWMIDTRGRIIIEDKKALTKRGIASPDYADALMLTFVDPPPPQAPAMVGRY